jgi:3-methyladenine DNA glycosylase AlkD
MKSLETLSDEKYAAFQRKLIPTVAAEQIIGVRTPQLRALAKAMVKSGESEALVRTLPHRYFEENQLHAFILSAEKDFDACIREVDRFLPYVDNWATCDQLSPLCFAKNTKSLLPWVIRWMKSEREYTVRFGIGMLMRHFLDEGFEPEFLDMVAAIRRDEYYIRMMQAWYFATALAKQYSATVPYIVQCRLPQWTHNKTIQKAVESYRISDEQKAYLKTLHKR